MTYVNEASVLGVSVLFLILGTLAVLARVFLQLKTSRLAADDWFSFLAWSLVMGECGIMIAGATTHTVGAHSTPNLGPEVLVYDGWDQMLLERFEYPFDLIQIFALATLKLSVLLFYRRIFVTRTFKLYNSILIGVVVVWAITFLVCLLAQCGSNIAANFGTLGDLKTKCTDTFAILIGLAASDVAVDLIILSIPMPLVISLYLPLKKRIGIVTVLAIGMLATACGIARMSLFIEILGPSRELPHSSQPVFWITMFTISVFSKPTVGGVSSDDDIGIVSILMFWGMLEMGIAVVAVCLPVLYRLRRHWSPKHLMVRLRSYGLSKDENPPPEIFDLDDPRHTAWLQTQAGECIAQASHAPKTSGDAESQNSHVRGMEIWEHTKITQTSEIV